MSDLLDKLRDPNSGVLTDSERKRALKKRQKTGHAWLSGTGPQGETCKSCKHLVRRQYSRVHLKCGLMRAQWTNSYGTDVRASDPACKKWEKDA